MPNALIKKYAERAKTTPAHVEEIWAKAKQVAKERFKDTKSPHYWAYVNAITQRGLKLKEDHSFKEFMDDMAMADVTPDTELPITVPTEPQPAPPVSAAPAEPPVNKQSTDGGKLVSMLFGARDWAHTLHLKTKSHAMHLALGELYTDLVDLADGLAETTQGKHGLLTVLADSSEFSGTDELGFVGKLADWLETQGRTCIDPGDTYLLNQLDEVLAAVYRAKYKLENLK